ncbi:MAG: AAA family ATPase, partial [Okeania sp. SIO2D1]|nr:AAA family ATPase [Okeania sp. SIO2D1]
MAQPAKCLLIGSIEACSGKSATIVGIADQLRAKGIEFSYGKPLGTYVSEDQTGVLEEDVQFMAKILSLQ